ncbi:hypothetical protein HJFPF1_03776 [Paramyrothecium foliicola]|nr:hypothetical protein HJFPF1_03776 [Paramyrothecium foliicola]
MPGPGLEKRYVKMDPVARIRSSGGGVAGLEIFGLARNPDSQLSRKLSGRRAKLSNLHWFDRDADHDPDNYLIRLGPYTTEIMGFASGFTGGVTLTLSVAYLSVLAHQRIREQQSLSLRTQALALQHLVDPIPAPLPPPRSEIAAAQRNTALETVKDRWNQEVRNVAQWAQTKDWEEAREGVEQGVAKLWTQVFGESAVAAEQAKEKLEPLAKRAKYETASKASEAAADARRKASEEVSRAEGAAKSGAEEAKGVLGSALEKGKAKAQELAGRAKAAASILEDKAEVKADGKILPAKTAVEKALHQRYESPEARARLDKTVAQTLAERYKPVDEQDNTVLRGV